ncbi:MAG TPA: response regulator [Lachnospiraceae bacterium]|nr:response regulator [Lachnospiraceae bacterium]
MYRILLVERNETLISELTEFFMEEYSDCEISAIVDSRKDAIKRIKEFRPDIAVVNTYIMGIDSLEAATNLRDYNEKMRIILVSEYDYSEFSREDIVLHVGNCVLTPAISAVLFRAIEQCVTDLEREEFNRIEVQTAKKGL